MSLNHRKISLLPIMGVTLLLLVAAYLRLRLLAVVPFGWHHDEAVKGIMALEFLQGGRIFRVFIPSYTGREPLYIYLEALALGLFGRDTFSVRVLSGFIGMLTVACTYQLGHRMFNRRVAWIATGLVAASLWQIIASRNGYRAVLQPLVQLPSIIFLWRGLKAGRYRDYALSGGFAGLAQYVYPAARFFPLMLALFGVGVLIARRGSFKTELLRWLLMGGVALLVFAPLGGYFVAHPGLLLGRANQVSVFNPAVNGGDVRAALLENVRRTALMFSTTGDPNYRFNLRGRPVFTLPEAVLFGLGLLMTAVGLLRQKGLRHLAYLLLWLWLVVMLVPMVLTTEGIPYFQRALGIVPAVFLLPALALDWLLSLPVVRGWKVAQVGLLAGAFVGLTLVVRREYFVEWHTAQAGYDDRGLDMMQVSEYVAEQPPGQKIYISTQFGQNPVTAWYAPDRYGDLYWFNASKTMVYPPPGEAVEYVFAAHVVPNEDLLSLAGDLQRREEVFDSFGRVAFTTFLWPADGQLPQPQFEGPLYWSLENTYPELKGQAGEGTLEPLDAPVDVGHNVLFLGYDIVDTSVRPGETLTLILHWRIINVPDHSSTIFLHLIDADTKLIVGYDSGQFTTQLWAVGETFTSYHPLAIPPDTPPADYLIQLGMYNPHSGERSTIYNADGMPVDARLLAGPIRIGGR